MRAAIYCRLSDEDRNKQQSFAESESIKNQKSLLLEYCHAQQWEVADIFCDEDMSGADNTRPEFNRMIAECEKGNIHVVVCKTQSRFSRDMEVVERYIHNKFPQWGVRFIGLLDHADTEDHANKKSRQINGLINEWYLEDLSENIKKTLRHKKENGIYTGAFAPFGYQLHPDMRGKLFIDEPAAEIVRRIYHAYLSGMGYVKIAKQLNADGVPSPSEYKRLCGSKFKTHTDKPTGTVWTDSTVRQILTNPVYCGTLVQGKTEKISYKTSKRRTVAKEHRIITEHTHAPIVDISVWQKVNQRIGGGYRSQKQSGVRHIFSGRIFCAECGSSMWKMSYRLKNGRYEYFKCKATKCATHLCTNTESIRFDAVFDAVEKEIRAIFSKYYDAEKIEYTNVVPPVKEEGFDSESVIRSQLLKQKSNMKQLYKDKLDGIIEVEEFIDIYQDIKKHIALLTRQLETVKPEENEKVPEYIKVFADKFILDEFVVSCLIEKIEIGKVDPSGRKITIYWNI